MKFKLVESFIDDTNDIISKIENVLNEFDKNNPKYRYKYFDVDVMMHDLRIDYRFMNDISEEKCDNFITDIYPSIYDIVKDNDIVKDEVIFTFRDYYSDNNPIIKKINVSKELTEALGLDTYETFNDRLKYLPKEKLDIIKQKQSKRYHEKKYKDKIDEYNIRTYGFTW